MSLLRLESISKHFGAVQALSNVNFEVASGEVVALVGDNGAGKSTLIKIISGAQAASSGSFFVDGRQVTIRKPEDARQLGIETVYQDLALFDNSNVAENIFAGREEVRKTLGIPFLRNRIMHKRSAELLKSLHIHIQSTRLPVKGMSGGQRQSVAIARAVAFGRRIVILDEPTAALGVPEQQKVISLVKDLKERGFSVIVISHNMQQVFEMADRVHVLRQGKTAGIRLTKDVTPNDIVQLITGSDQVGTHANKGLIDSHAEHP